MSIEDIRDEDLILCPVEGNFIFLPVITIEKHYNYKGNIVEIVTERGDKIASTPEHRLIIVEEDQ